MLVQLLNGNWIDPTQILAIKAEIVPERVIVVLKGITEAITIPTETYKEACLVRDEIARAVNTASVT
jgi:hypothetical protein